MSQILLSLVINLSFLLLNVNATAPSDFRGSRSILRAIEVNSKDGTDIVVELNATNIDSLLKDSPAAYAVVEFFANWCPACRNYKPHYERVARLFNGPHAVHPGVILMTRLDCALKINYKLCDNFSVTHFPMLFWGPSVKFVSGGWKPKEESSGIKLIDENQTADRLLNWINKQIGSSYGLDEQKFENEHLPSNKSNPGQIARAIYDVEEATATAFDIIVSHKMVKSETRVSLLKFLQLLVVHHPSKRCRKGSAETLVNFDEFFPPEVRSTKHEIGDFWICGKEIPRGYWMFCRGSKNETRGFSCGLWVLLHSLSVRVEDGESQFAFTATCKFIHNFFVCQECRQHFYKMCTSVSKPFEKARDFVLWLWSAHNKVNERLMRLEASLGTNDPKYPKIIWPQKELCPSCYRSNSWINNGTTQVDWDQDEVYKFLKNYYGEALLSAYKDKDIRENNATNVFLEESTFSSNAIVVPIGAALAIAVASCAFGALACYWRSRQKRRKHSRNLHSYKNI